MLMRINRHGRLQSNNFSEIHNIFLGQTLPVFEQSFDQRLEGRAHTLLSFFPPHWAKQKKDNR
jgi:hypothetical protein